MKITQDLHVHTNLSVCAKPAATFDMYMETAKEKGITTVGFADHLWDDTYEHVCPGFYRKQNVDRVLSLKDVMRPVEEIDVYLGCEAEYDPKICGVALSPENAEKFDFVIVPVSHTHMVMPKDLYEPIEKHKQFMLDAWRNVLNCDVTKYVTAMAHPFQPVCCPYGWEPMIEYITDDEYKYAFDMAAEKNVAVEINLAGLRWKSEENIKASPLMRMFRIAKDCGCRFTFGSDSHNQGGHEGYNRAGEYVSELLGLCEDDVVCLTAKNK